MRLDSSAKASSWTENKLHCVQPLGKVQLQLFEVTVMNTGKVKCSTRLKQHSLSFSSPSTAFPLHPIVLLFSPPALCDVQITLWARLIRGISEGVRHLKRPADPDLFACASGIARSCPWISVVTFPWDRWHNFLLRYVHSFPTGSWLANCWKHWDNSRIN